MVTTSTTTLAAVALSALLVGCGRTEPPAQKEAKPRPAPSTAAPSTAAPPKPVSGADSPKALLERLKVAIEARDLALLKSCFPQRTEGEKLWAEGCSQMILVSHREAAWRRKAHSKFPDYYAVFGGSTPDPGGERNLDMARLVEHFRPDSVTGDEASVSVPYPPGAGRVADPHELVRVEGRWFYKSWNYGKEESMREIGPALRDRAKQANARYDRIEPLLEAAASAKELKEKMDRLSK